MTSLNALRSRLVDTIMAAENEELLRAVETILNSAQEVAPLKLDEYQLKMLDLSEEDIKAGRLVSEDELRRADSQWMD